MPKILLPHARVLPRVEPSPLAQDHAQGHQPALHLVMATDAMAIDLDMTAEAQQRVEVEVLESEATGDEAIHAV